MFDKHFRFVSLKKRIATALDFAPSHIQQSTFLFSYNKRNNHSAVVEFILKKDVNYVFKHLLCLFFAKLSGFIAFWGNFSKKGIIFQFMDFEGKSDIFALKNNFISRKRPVFFRLKSLYYFNKMKREVEENLKKSGVKL